MKTVPLNSPFGETVFCDDLRFEANGKHIYIGVYNGIMIVPQIPMQIPNFICIVNYRELAETESDDIFIKCLCTWQTDPLGEIEIKRSQIQSPPDFSRNENEDQIFSLQTFFNFSPLYIPSIGSIKIRAYVGEREIKLGSISIKSGPVYGQQINGQQNLF